MQSGAKAQEVQKKVRPVPVVDPNEERKEKGLRLVVSEVPFDELPKVAIVGASQAVHLSRGALCHGPFVVCRVHLWHR